jgi:acetyl esterase/lipase
VSTPLDRRQVLARAPALLLAAAAGCPPRAGMAQAALSDPGPAAAATTGSDPAEAIELWPGGPPGGEDVVVVEEVVARPPPPGLSDRIVRGVRVPLLTVFRPVRAHGGAVLVVPGGGYRHVVIDKEGFETARWLAARGCTVAVLRYRLPGDRWSAGPDAPLQDAQRALRLLRAHAASLGIDPRRVGVLGFSAGGHLAARLAFESDLPSYEPRDAVDTGSARPDYAGLIYPVVTMRADEAHAGSRERLIGDSPSPQQVARYSVEEHVPPDAPPVFLLHAADDASVPVGNALRLYSALRAASVPAELHVFAEGGHGFGLRAIEGRPVSAWPGLFEAWAARGGFLAPRG